MYKTKKDILGLSFTYSIEIYTILDSLKEDEVTLTYKEGKNTIWNFSLSTLLSYLNSGTYKVVSNTKIHELW